MSEDDFPTDGDNSKDGEQAGREHGAGSLRKRVLVYLLTIVVVVAVGELVGVRTLVKYYLNPAVLDSSVIEDRIAALKEEAREQASLETRVLGRGFRSCPDQVGLPADAVSLPDGSARLVVTEVQPANAGEVVDGDGKCPDWIELWNPGDRPFDTRG